MVNRSVILKITYDSEGATKRGIINMVSECSGAIVDVEEVKEKK